MEKQISFQGVSLNPYGDISPDGELSACVNLQSHGGALRPSELGGTPITVFDIANLIFIHATPEYRHMIFYDGTNLLWAEETDTIASLNAMSATLDNVKSVNAIGNTLITLSDEGIRYFLFKEETYMDLGEMPEVSISFGLKGTAYYSDSITVNVDSIDYADINKEFSDSNKRKITDAAMSLLNSFVEEKKRNGMFIFPFFVRYAFRLYNGDLIKHSSPVLMCVSSKGFYALTSLERNQTISQVPIQFIGCFYALYYKVVEVSGRMSDWKDIIQSVDVFISDSIYTYYPDKTCDSFENYSLSKTYSVCTTPKSTLSYKKNTFLEICNDSFDSFYDDKKKISMPYKTEDEINKEFESVSNFYYLTSLKDITTISSSQKIDISYEMINNIVFKERMTDDFESNDRLLPKFSFVYNKRLVISNIIKEISKGFNFKSYLCLQEMVIGSYHYYYCYVYANINNEDVCYLFQGIISAEVLVVDYLFIPNLYVKKIVIYYTGNICTLEMRQHPLLNGMYYCSAFKTLEFVSGDEPVEYGNMKVNLPNTLYVSQVDNPFYFPVAGVNNVGTGEIIGISSVTTALSQGQFGSFPLMAFCTDGNYALQVNSEGLFSAVTPMQRDVCTNPKSITQIDGAIIFVTARGVMVADGSSIQPLSKILDGVQPDISQFAADAGLSEDLSVGIPSMPPVDFFQSCIIAYDYPNKRLLFMSESREDKAFGWQYCIDEQCWQQINFGNAKSTVNVFPSSYVQHTRYIGSFIKRLDKPYDYDVDGNNKGFILTRPLKLDSLQPKSISQIMLEGNFEKDSQKLVLFGSNDLKRWHRIASTTNRRMLLRGRYFKFYRIAVSTSLGNGENVSGLRVIYNVRPDYRLR